MKAVADESCFAVGESPDQRMNVVLMRLNGSRQFDVRRAIVA